MTVRTTFVSLLAAILFASCALAVCKVDMPVSKMLSDSKSAAVGTITGINLDNGVVDVKITETFKGDIGAESLRVQLAYPKDLVKTVAKDRPVVIMLSARGALLHLADTWLNAEPIANTKPIVWQTKGNVPMHEKAFPGSTESLAKALSEMSKAGKDPLLNVTDARVADDIRKGTKLDVAKATALLTGDVNGDGKSDLLIGTASGVKLFLATDKGYDDATAAWGLEKAAGEPLAVGVLGGAFGKWDVLVGDTVYVNDGGKFVAKGKIESGGFKPIAATVVDVDADGKNDILLLATDGQLLVFKNPGDLSKPWAKEARTLWKDDPAAGACFGDFGDAGRPHVLVVREAGVTRYTLDASQAPADFRRLAGVELRTYYKRYADGLKSPRIVALDINGDGRRDAVAICRTGGLMMINRGFGVFLDAYDAGDSAPDAAKQTQTLVERFKAAAAADLLAPTTLLAPGLARDGKSEDLIAITEDGQVYVLVNFAGKK